MRLKRLTTVILALLLMITLTSCWDSVDLEQRGFVIVIGIDKAENKAVEELSKNKSENQSKNQPDNKNQPENQPDSMEDDENIDDEFSEKLPKNNENNNSDTKEDNGNNDNDDKNKQNSNKNIPVEFDYSDDIPNKFAVSIVLPNLSSINGGGGGQETSKSVINAESKTIGGAIMAASMVSSEKLYFGHTKVCVIGKELLNDRDLFREMLDYFERNREISRKVIILASENSARDVLSLEPSNEPLIGRFITNFFKNNTNNVAVTERFDLEQLLKQLLDTSYAVIPEIKIIGGDGEKSGEIKISGAVLMNDYKAAGYLDDELMRGYLWFKGKCDGAELNAKYNNGFVPARIITDKTKVHFFEENGKLKCIASVRAEGVIEEYPPAQDTLTDIATMESLALDYENIIAAEMLKTEDFFKECGADGFGYKDLVRKYNNSLFLKYISNWQDVIQDSELIPDVEVVIRNAGPIK